MLELKNMSGIITNSSSEVYIFNLLDEAFSDFISEYTGDLNFILLRSKEEIDEAMKSGTAETKLLEYCDIFRKKWIDLKSSEKELVYSKLLGKSFLFNCKFDPEEDTFWFLPRDIELPPHEETYIG